MANQPKEHKDMKYGVYELVFCQCVEERAYDVEQASYYHPIQDCHTVIGCGDPYQRFDGNEYGHAH